MNKQELVKTLNKAKFNVVKHSPEIFMYTGAIGTVVASVMACKSSMKLNSVLDMSKQTLEQIVKTQEDDSVEYTEEDAKKDKIIILSSTALDIVKLYAPSVILGGISIACMIQSHNILNKRNAALAAAFTTVNESFKKYRKAVVDRYGERTDFELKHNIKSEKVEVTETDENGKTKKKKVNIDVMNCEPSEYARYFDQSCDGWTNDPEYNKMFLKSQQQYANDKLQAKGFLFLNDVYKALGIPISKAGQIVGWVYDAENPQGDNYVDFGMWDVNIPEYRDNITNDTIGEERRDFVNGYIPSLLLDFNVDGNVWEKMGE